MSGFTGSKDILLQKAPGTVVIFSLHNKPPPPFNPKPVEGNNTCQLMLLKV